MKKGCLYSIIASVVISTLFLGFYLWRKSNKASDDISHYQAKYGNIIKKTVTSGSIRPSKEVLIKAQISGIIEALYVKPGDIVKSGQAIAKIKMIPSPTNLNTAKSAVELAQIGLRNAQQQLKAQKILNVEKWDAANSKSELAFNKTEMERSKKLLNDGVISEQEYLRIKTNFEIAKANYENVKINVTANIDQLENQSELRQAELNQAINNLQLMEQGIAKKSGQVSNIIKSTISGMVLEIPIEEGFSVVERNNFNDGTTIASVADMSELIFEGMVDESDVGLLKIGMPIKIKIGAIANQEFDGKLQFIAPKGEVNEGAVKFEIKSSISYSSDLFIRAGYSASGDIILDEVKEVLTIKERDLIFENGKKYIEIHLGGNDYDKIEVETALSNGIDIAIIKGIDTTMMIKALELITNKE